MSPGCAHPSRTLGAGGVRAIRGKHARLLSRIGSRAGCRLAKDGGARRKIPTGYENDGRVENGGGLARGGGIAYIDRDCPASSTFARSPGRVVVNKRRRRALLKRRTRYFLLFLFSSPFFFFSFVLPAFRAYYFDSFRS